jgi:hypothetical protein
VVATGQEPAFRGGGAKGVVIGLRHVAVREPASRIGERSCNGPESHGRSLSQGEILEPINVDLVF